MHLCKEHGKNCCSFSLAKLMQSCSSVLAGGEVSQCRGVNEREPTSILWLLLHTCSNVLIANDSKPYTSSSPMKLFSSDVSPRIVVLIRSTTHL